MSKARKLIERDDTKSELLDTGELTFYLGEKLEPGMVISVDDEMGGAYFAILDNKDDRLATVAFVNQGGTIGLHDIHNGQIKRIEDSTHLPMEIIGGLQRVAAYTLVKTRVREELRNTRHRKI